jgi:hypothetical protein
VTAVRTGQALIKPKHVLAAAWMATAASCGSPSAAGTCMHLVALVYFTHCSESAGAITPGTFMLPCRIFSNTIPAGACRAE